MFDSEDSVTENEQLQFGQSPGLFPQTLESTPLIKTNAQNSHNSRIKPKFNHIDVSVRKFRVKECTTKAEARSYLSIKNSVYP